jgi:SAM-dependent methyltransferase
MLKKLDRIFRSFFPKRMRDYVAWVSCFKGLKGLEIGGPSPAFSSKGFLPIYPLISGLDGCNFSSSTVWEGKIEEGNNYRYDNKSGRQYITDATDLSQIADAQYDFVLSCHSLEHIANPIKAIYEWKRVIRDDGYLLVVLPHKDGTFDHNRPVTTLAHMIADFNAGMGEDDNTHFTDAIELHDIALDPGIENYKALVERTKNNFTNRCVHHHIFNTPLLVQLLDYTRFQVLRIGHFTPFHILVLARKTDEKLINNTVKLDPSNPVYINSRFPSDRL